VVGVGECAKVLNKRYFMLRYVTFHTCTSIW